MRRSLDENVRGHAESAVISTSGGRWKERANCWSKPWRRADGSFTLPATAPKESLLAGAAEHSWSSQGIAHELCRRGGRELVCPVLCTRDSCFASETNTRGVSVVAKFRHGALQPCVDPAEVCPVASGGSTSCRARVHRVPIVSWRLFLRGCACDGLCRWCRSG